MRPNGIGMKLHTLFDRIENGEINHPLHTRDEYQSMDTQALLTKIDKYCERNNASSRSTRLKTGLAFLDQAFRGARLNSPAMIEAALDKLGVEKDSEFDNPHRYLDALYETATEQGYTGLENIRVANEISKVARQASRGHADPISMARAEKAAVVQAEIPFETLGT
jgi:hypothetical protein